MNATIKPAYRQTLPARTAFHTVPDFPAAIVAKEYPGMREGAQRYLIESNRRFPPMPEFERMIREAGFERTKVEPILGGLVAIHSGWKI